MKYVFTLFIYSLFSWSLAQQNSGQPYAEVEVSSFNVVQGEVLALSVNIYNDKAKSPPLISTHPSLSMVASSHQFQQKNRQLIDSYIYQVTIKKPGIIELPAIEIYTQKGGLIKTAPLKFIAHDFKDIAWDTLSVEQQTLTYGTLLSANNTKPYVGQMASAYLKVILPANINIEEFRELDIKFNNVAADPFSLQNAPLNTVNTIRVDSGKYQIYNFNTQFSCLNPQAAQIGDGELTLAVRAVNRSLGIFQTYTTIDLNFDIPSIAIRAQELPAGKPADFSGIIGEFTLSSSANLDNYQSYNDVINVVFNLQGEGNFNDTIIPQMTDQTHWQVYPTQIVNAITQNNYHDITFHQIIRSSQPQKTIPSYSFNYFNPKTGTYETAQSKPIELPSLVVNSAEALADINTRKLTQPLGLLVVPLNWQQLLVADLSSLTILIFAASTLVLTLYLVILICVLTRKRVQAKSYYQLKIQLLQSLKNSKTRQSFYKSLLHHVDSYMQQNHIDKIPQDLSLEQEQWLAHAYNKEDLTPLNQQQAHTSIKLILHTMSSCKTRSKDQSQAGQSALSLIIILSLFMMSSLASWAEATSDHALQTWNRAFELYEQDQPQQALEIYQSLIQSEQQASNNTAKLADLYFNLGICYEELQRIDLAHLAYRYSLSLQPSHPTSLHNVSLLVDKYELTEPAADTNWVLILSDYGIWLISLALLLTVISIVHVSIAQKITHKTISIAVLVISCIFLLGSSIIYVYNKIYKENITSSPSSSPSLAIIISATPADYFESASSQSTRLGSFASGAMVYIKAPRQPYSLVQSLTHEDNSALKLGWLNNRFFCPIAQASQILLQPFSVSNAPPFEPPIDLINKKN